MFILKRKPNICGLLAVLSKPLLPIKSVKVNASSIFSCIDILLSLAIVSLKYAYCKISKSNFCLIIV